MYAKALCVIAQVANSSLLHLHVVYNDDVANREIELDYFEAAFSRLIKKLINDSLSEV